MLGKTSRRGFVILIVATTLSLTAPGSADEIVNVLDLPGSGTSPEQIDYDSLPRVAGKHVIIRPAARGEGVTDQDKYDLHNLKFQLHSYLAHRNGRFWCIWSEGPPIEDEPTQEVRFATSSDGLDWSESAPVTGTPEAPYAFIARGLWVRQGQLIALAAHFKGKGAFGADKELKLRAYAWDEGEKKWRFMQTVYDNAINNFPPQKLPTGEWILTRRDARFNVSVLIGGTEKIERWKSYPVVGIGEVAGFRPDEPIFWHLDGEDSLLALFRDNSGSRRLFHAKSEDYGKHWTTPQITNFPNATSKIFSMQASNGVRVLVSNANPQRGRRQLHLSLSEGGRTFTRMALLAIPSPPPVEDVARIEKKFQTGIASLQYPHMIEHDRALLIAFSRNKKQIELLRIPLESIAELVEK